MAAGAFIVGVTGCPLDYSGCYTVADARRNGLELGVVDRASDGRSEYWCVERKRGGADWLYAVVTGRTTTWTTW